MTRKRNELHQLIGERLRELRIKQDWTQLQLAARLGYQTHSSVSGIELGYSTLPYDRLVRACLAFNISPNEFFCWVD